MTPRIHYAGAARYGRTRILAGWAACCSGTKADRIRATGQHTYVPAGVTCAACRRVMAKAGIVVEAMVALLDADDAPPPADPALLASANRALAEQVERLEANATAREGVLRREHDALRKAERERDALRDAVGALLARHFWHPPPPDPEADAAWAALCRLLTPSTPTETT